jgi:hypothetical protein
MPGAEDAAATVDDAPPPGRWVRVQEFPPENYVEPPPLNTMPPVGIDVDAESLTSAVHALTLLTARLGGLQVTLVRVGSIAASSARHHGPPEALMKFGWMLLAPADPIVARPIAPAPLSTQYNSLPSVATPVGSCRPDT